MKLSERVLKLADRIEKVSFLKGKDILSNFMKDKTIFIENKEYIGKASDGAEVNLGNVGDELKLYSYLESHPKPDTW